MSYDKDKLAELVRSSRIARGYTQLEVAEHTRISLRSIQRIENGEVAPRLYTIKVLAAQLGFNADDALLAQQPGVVSTQNQAMAKNNLPRRWILSVGGGLMLLLGSAAFLSQTRRFPETYFEAFCFWTVIIFIYTGLLWRIWK